MRNTFYFIGKALFVLEIFKFLDFHLPPLFSFSTTALNDEPKVDLKVYGLINFLNKSLITFFDIWRRKKGMALKLKKHFYGKIMQKMCT